MDAGAHTTSTVVRVGSCDRVSTAGVCSEYSGNYLSSNEVMLTASCGKLAGTFVYAECPNTSLVGACTLSTGEVRRFYGGGSAPWTADKAQVECEGPNYRGTWRGLPRQ